MFPAFHMSEHIMLQAGDTAEFTVVVGWDTFTGAAVLPHILKTCRCSGHYLYNTTQYSGQKMSSNFVTGKTLQLTNDTLCDCLQLFAERGYGLERRPFDKL